MYLDLNAEFRDLLGTFDNTMYRDLSKEDEVGLRTGDIIFLDKSDFKDILRYFKSFEKLFDHFEATPKYKSKFWAVLNKPCDMVHEGNGRRFDTNLFLCPLQGFISGFSKKEFLNKLKEQPLSIEEYHQILGTIFRAFLKKYLNSKFPISKDTPKLQKEALVKEKEEASKDMIDSVLNTGCFNIPKTEDPESVEILLRGFAEEGNVPQNTLPFFQGLSQTAEWIEYKTAREIAFKDEKRINISKDKFNELSMFFRNQTDTQGLFYFEPNDKLFSEAVRDFSYYIELEDMLTFKVSEEAIEKGLLVKKLLNNRRVGLNRNFSDRLQNIMGNYFSKIGTKDVKSNNILSLYSASFELFNYRD